LDNERAGRIVEPVKGPISGWPRTRWKKVQKQEYVGLNSILNKEKMYPKNAGWKKKDDIFLGGGDRKKWLEAKRRTFTERSASDNGQKSG